MVLAFIIGAASVGFAYCWCACLASVLRGWSSWPEISDEVVQDIARQVWDLGKGNSNISGSLDVVEAHTRAVLEIAGRDGVVAEGEDESSFTE
jgi:hypothetical protein